jgi:hypothetical protein
MTHQWPIQSANVASDAASRIAQLQHVLELVTHMGGGGRNLAATDNELDDLALLGAAYDGALPIVRKRFDTLASETAAWSAAGVQALLTAGAMERSAPAARRLADELADAIARLSSLLSR